MDTKLKKIVATFMHESEMGPASAIFQKDKDHKLTNSFFIGMVDDNDIEELKKLGLIVREIQENQQVITPGKVQDYFESKNFVDPIRKKSTAKVGQADVYMPKEDDFYILTISGPLISEYFTVFLQHQVSLIDRIPDNSYTVYLTPAQYGLIKNNTGGQFSFITSTEPYDASDTGSYVNKDSVKRSFISKIIKFFTRTEQFVNRDIVFDVLLHRETDLPVTLEWFKSNQIDVVSARYKKIRIKLKPSESKLKKIADYKFIKAFEEYDTPTFKNNVACQIMKLEASAGNPSSIVRNILQTGLGETIGIADTGLDIGHPDLQNVNISLVSIGRSATSDTSDPVGHGTHVTGSIVGNGASSNGEIKGTATGANIFFQSLIDETLKIRLPDHLQDLFQQAYDAGARIHNNSWGSSTASTYTINSQEVDEFVHARKDMLVVISAGNQGNGANPVNVNEGLIDLGSIGAPATAKNALTVGASRSIRTQGGYSVLTYGAKWRGNFPFPPIKDEKISGDMQGLAAFSSRGPTTFDFRIKPDLVAPGTDILSLKSSIADVNRFWGPFAGTPMRYAYMGGTSMSAPLVAGCAALVREYYRTDRNLMPSASLLKATLINGTDQLQGKDALADHAFLPNYHQGFGIINMIRTIPNTVEQFSLIFKDTWNNNQEQFLDARQGDRFRYQFFCNGGGWLRFCMSYTDHPALGIQNVLDVILENVDTRTKWTTNDNRPVVRPVIGNRKTPDNVQIIRLDNVPAGKFVVQISAPILLKTPQDFSFVVTGNTITSDIQQYSSI